MQTNAVLQEYTVSLSSLIAWMFVSKPDIAKAVGNFATVEKQGKKLGLRNELHYTNLALGLDVLMKIKENGHDGISFELMQKAKRLLLDPKYGDLAAFHEKVTADEYLLTKQSLANQLWGYALIASLKDAVRDRIEETHRKDSLVVA